MQANAVKCTLCMDFRCNRCEEANLANDLVMDGETCGSVKNLCYLGVDLAATARIRNECMKFREIMKFLTSRDERSSVYQLYQKQYDLWN